MRVPMVVFLFLVLALSGCMEEYEGTPSPPDEAAGTTHDQRATARVDVENVTQPPLPWNVTASGCTILVASTPLLADPTRERLPSGFEPVPFQGIPGTAGAALVVTRCANAVANGTVFEAHQEALVYIYVVPPAEYRANGIDQYRVMVRHGVNADGLIAAYTAANTTVEKATTRAGTTTVGPELRVLEAAAEFSDMAFSFRSTLQRFDAVEPILYRLFIVEDGEVAGAIDLELKAADVWAGAGAYVVERGALFGRPAFPTLGVQYEIGTEAAYILTPVLDWSPPQA